jgi:hypothetical protein
MAWRFDQAVIRGELDNTERGRVQVRLEVVGRSEPILLDLTGDAWRDIAGSRLHFVNPNPKHQYKVPPCSGVQTGVVGDITASRKVKVFTVPEEEWKQAYMEDRIDSVPTEMRNSLYLEWYADEHGRCVVESADFELQVIEHAWQMDEDEEAAQKMANMHVMREYLADIIQRPPESEDDECDPGLRQEDFTEEKWEEQLKASDRLNDASMEAHDKYEEDEDSAEKIAYVMGWDHIIEDMADAQEGVQPSEDDPPEKKRRREWIESMNEACRAVEEGEYDNAEDDDPQDAHLDDDGVEDDDIDSGFDTVRNHPLNRKSRDFMLRIFNEMKTSGLNDVRDGPTDHPLDRFLSNTMQISGKLAAATSMMSRRRPAEIDIETGHVLAITKRCLNWANEALAALQDLCEHPDYTVHLALFEGWQKELFSLRDGITDLRRELHGG